MCALLYLSTSLPSTSPSVAAATCARDRVVGKRGFSGWVDEAARALIVSRVRKDTLQSARVGWERSGTDAVAGAVSVCRSGSGSADVVDRLRFLFVVGWLLDAAVVGTDASSTPVAEHVVVPVGLALPVEVAVTDAFTVTFAGAGAGVGTAATDLV